MGVGCGVGVLVGGTVAVGVGVAVSAGDGGKGVTMSVGDGGKGVVVAVGGSTTVGIARGCGVWVDVVWGVGVSATATASAAGEPTIVTVSVGVVGSAPPPQEVAQSLSLWPCVTTPIRNNNVRSLISHLSQRQRETGGVPATFREASKLPGRWPGVVSICHHPVL